MKNRKPAVFIFIALACEAKPLIQKYALKKLSQQHPFELYSNDKIAVIITGVGKVAMAGAVTYSMAIFPEIQKPLLLNLGIAGHKNKPLGAMYLADKIIDAENSKKKFYPQLVGSFPSPSTVLCTVSKPHKEYTGDCLYDMEAAAFYEMAIKFSSSELIHCLKVISDNQDQPADTVNAKTVSVWIDQQLTVINIIVEHLMALRLSITEPQPILYQALIEQYHFTVTAQIKLKALLQRWDVVTDKSSLVINHSDFTNGKQILVWLERIIERQDFSL